MILTRTLVLLGMMLCSGCTGPFWERQRVDYTDTSNQGTTIGPREDNETQPGMGALRKGNTPNM